MDEPIGTVLVAPRNVVYDESDLRGEYDGRTVKTGDIVEDKAGDLWRVKVVVDKGQIVRL